MKNVQLIGLILVIVGSFLPLLNIPLIGNWNYWKIDPYLASIVWILCAISFYLIQKEKLKATRIVSGIIMVLFVFTIIAIKMKSNDFFSFLPFKSWQSAFSGIVKISWGWSILFVGTILMLVGFRKKEKLEN